MKQEEIVNNKRIAKNTIALYLRTFITMIVGLYMGRVMLRALGVEDYGIYTVVGGIVSMSSLITATMSASISRYITYMLGQGKRERLKIMFSTSINAQIIMSFIIVIVLEIVGVWFLNKQATIPQERLNAANYVLQCGIISLVVSLISSPYNALIIAHERMSVYAYVSIIDAFFKLAICFIIEIFNGDRLILFAILNIVEALMLQSFYVLYCGRSFEESHYLPKILDRGLIKEITIFSGWNLLGNTAWVFNTQGINMLVNVFFGVTYNASRGIAMQVNGAVQSFVNNFTTAFTPQITKSYAAGDIAYSINLTNRGTKLTWLMMYIFIVPVCMEADMILKLWLGQVPEMASTFLRLSLFESLAVQSGSSLFKLIQANGNVKKTQIQVSLLGLTVFPISWFVYKLGGPVWSAYIIFIVIYFSVNIIRYMRLRELMLFSIKQHLRDCIIPCLLVSITAFIVPIIFSYYVPSSKYRFFLNIPLSIMSTLLCSYFFGLTNGEKCYLKSILRRYIYKI